MFRGVGLSCIDPSHVCRVLGGWELRPRKHTLKVPSRPETLEVM